MASIKPGRVHAVTAATAERQQPSLATTTDDGPGAVETFVQNRAEAAKRDRRHRGIKIPRFWPSFNRYVGYGVELGGYISQNIEYLYGLIGI